MLMPVVIQPQTERRTVTAGVTDLVQSRRIRQVPPGIRGARATEELDVSGDMDIRVRDTGNAAARRALDVALGFAPVSETEELLRHREMVGHTCGQVVAKAHRLNQPRTVGPDSQTWTRR